MIKHNLPPGDYVGISKAGTTVAVVITEGGFWAHEFRSKLQVELDDIASIMPARPEARLAEPERPTLCAKCNDHIIADDGAVCEICAETMDTIITELQTRIAELEKCAIVWHRFPEEKPDNRGDYYLVAMEKYVHYRDAESDSEFDKVSEVPFVRVGWWYSPGGRFEMVGTQLNGVYAWAEMPNPPEEK